MERTLGPSLAWVPCPEKTVAAVVADLRARAPKAFATSSVLHARQCMLPFYRNAVLVDVRLLGVAGVAQALLLHDGAQTFWLDGQSSPIHAVNELESVQLTADTALDYVRFFLYVMRGEQGAFVVIEAPEEISAPAAADADSNSVRELRDRWSPLRLDGETDDGNLRVRATLAYAGALFASTFALPANGEIQMIDDLPLATLQMSQVPACPELKPFPEDPERPAAESERPPLLEVMRRTNDLIAEQERAAREKSDLPITQSFVAVLLSRAIEGALGHRLLQRFNSQSNPAGPIGQLARFMEEFAPIVIIESDIPFVEDIVVGLLDPERTTYPVGRTSHAVAVSGDDTRCWLDTRDAATRLHVASFHAYRSLWDAEWTAHQLAVGEPAVIIGCARREDVPEALQRVTDLVLKLPRIDEAVFVDVFRKVIGAPPPRRWRSGGGDWVRYLLHTDFHAPLRLNLTLPEAVDYLRERCRARLAQVSAVDFPALNDLHGLGEARQVAEDVIADVSAARAGRIPWRDVDRGLLLVGAPGTGKTTLARAIARECDIKFIQASATQWQAAGSLDMHVRAMRQTFAEARRYAPSILFIDEIDSIGNREQFTGSNSIYQTEVVNALLEQIQGMDASEPVIVIGATNHVEKVDPALRRAGRLDQVLQVPRPNVAGLELIFKYHLAAHRKAKQVDPDVKVGVLAQLAFGLTGADIEFFVRGAARRARKERRRMTQADLLAEVTRRPRKPDAISRLTDDDMRRVAVHETGHALSALLSTTGAPELTFVSIIPRMDGSLGFTASMPPEGAVMTRTAVLERLRTILAGRAAEELVYGKDDVSLSSGGSTASDLAVATRLATSVICTSGFGADGSLHWTTSPTPAQARQVNALLRSSYRAALALLRERRPMLERIAAALVAQQELDGDAVRALTGKMSTRHSTDEDATPERAESPPRRTLPHDRRGYLISRTVETGANSKFWDFGFQTTCRSQKVSLAKSAAGLLPQFLPITVSQSFAAWPEPSSFASYAHSLNALRAPPAPSPA